MAVRMLMDTATRAHFTMVDGPEITTHAFQELMGVTATLGNPKKDVCNYNVLYKTLDRNIDQIRELNEILVPCVFR